jgi:hypothetical protein
VLISSALHMPSQSILEEKEEEVNARNLTLKDLLARLRHHNESVRKGFPSDIDRN